MRFKLLLIPFLLVSVGAVLYSCDILSSNEPVNSSLNVQFQVTQTNQTKQKTVHVTASLPDDTLLVEGSNGTLSITDVHFIVSEFEFERAEGDCKADTADSDSTDTVREDECEEIEGGPSFIDLPLDGSAVDAVSSELPSGDYSEVEFEVENLDFEGEEEEEENEEEMRQQALIDSVKNKFPNWPENASLVVVGSFMPSESDTSRSFKAFVEAEIEVEKSFDPPLTVTDTAVPQNLKINISPDIWFKNSDGTVKDLSKYDYGETGKILELEVELENGFQKVEVEDQEDDEGPDDDSDDEEEEE